MGIARGGAEEGAPGEGGGVGKVVRADVVTTFGEGVVG